MGARSRNGKPKRVVRGDKSGAGVEHIVAAPPLPRCVARLESESYTELEEACEDLTLYSTQAKHHPLLVQAGVPQRLAELLSRPPFNPQQADPAAPLLARLHQGIIGFQIAAAVALRNFVTNSAEDAVVDGLVAHGYTDAMGQPQTYASLLLSSLFGTWALLKEVRRCVPQDEAALACFQEEHGEGDGVSLEDSGPHTAQPRRAIRLYFSLLHFHEQLLQLALVSIDGSEVVATAFSEPRVAAELLHQLEVCITEGSSIDERTPSVYTSDGSGAASHSFFRQEAFLLVHVTTSLADLLHVLSTDNAALAACFSSEMVDGDVGITSAQRTWLDSLINAETQLAWMSAQPPELTMVEGTSFLELQRNYILHQMVLAVLDIQGMLLNLFPSETNMTRVLPLTVAVLSTFTPIRQWRCILPLLKESCEVSEAFRGSVVRLTTSRLRAAKAAIDVLNTCVGFVCEQNSQKEEDDVAFRNNPMSALLFQSNALHAFGTVLKDALWMSEESAKNMDTSFDALRQSEHRALRLAAQFNSEVTTMQFVILSTEVGVWNLASSLLLMISTESLGEIPVIWRAMIAAVQSRSELLRMAYLADVECQHPAPAQQADTPEAVAHSVATESPAARHLLWLQLKSVMQILWTLQRKQSTSQGSLLDAANAVSAVPSDVDLLTRLVWERECPPALFQACVATVGYLCSSFQSPEAVSVATRFLLSALKSAGGAATLEDLEAGVLRVGAPTALPQRQKWLARLQRADEYVDVRCEAANILMDLFADERYDAAVYGPLGVQGVVTGFFSQLRTHLAARQRVGKELWKHNRVAASALHFDTWAEVAENLEGFLAYKRQNARV